ncbi:MAG TPA: hypothetical protein DCS88_00015 [Alphaproteobacteria bacterium]|nr:hypothetical protein [Alphaproteobacteria bacterium]
MAPHGKSLIRIFLPYFLVCGREGGGQGGGNSGIWVEDFTNLEIILRGVCQGGVNFFWGLVGFFIFFLWKLS